MRLCGSELTKAANFQKAAIRIRIKSNSERNTAMKKILSVLIAILLVTCFGTTAFASDVTTPGGSDSKDVKATYQSGGTLLTVYSVDVTWGSMEFIYLNDSSPGIWNPATHQYEGAGMASWTCDANANKITVTNHSNISISAGLTYAKETGFTGINGTFSKSTINLATAVGVLPANAPTDSSLFTLEGALGSGTAAKTVIGSVTVTIT